MVNAVNSLRCLHYEPIKLILLMEWTHQHYIVYSMVPTNVCSLRNRPIKLKLLAVINVGLMGLSCKQCAFDGSYSVNNVGLLSPYCKQRTLMNPWCKQRKLNGSMLQATQVWLVHIKFILFMVWTHHTYVDYSIYLSILRYLHMDTWNLRFYQYGHTKHTLLTVWTHQA
jgi:hypothetical protein